MRVCLTLSILFPAFGDKTTTTEGNLPTKQTGLYAVYLLFRNSDLVWDCAHGKNFYKSSGIFVPPLPCVIC